MHREVISETSRSAHLSVSRSLAISWRAWYRDGYKLADGPSVGPSAGRAGGEMEVRQAGAPPPMHRRPIDGALLVGQRFRFDSISGIGRSSGGGNKSFDCRRRRMEYEVQGPRPRRRPKRTWGRKVVKEDCQATKLNTQDAMDRSKWRKLIKDVR